MLAIITGAPRRRGSCNIGAIDWPNVPLGLLAAQVVDEHPQVRLEAVRVLSHFPTPRAFDLAMYALDAKPDRFLDYALWLTSRELAPEWLPALEAGQLDFHGRESQLIFALAAVDSPAIIKPLVTLFESGQVPANREESALTMMGRLGGPDELAMIFKLAVSTNEMADERRLKLLVALARATKDRGVLPSGDLSDLGRLLGSSQAEVRAAAIRAAGLWRVAGPRKATLRLRCRHRRPRNGAWRRDRCSWSKSVVRPSRLKLLENLAAADQQLAIRRLATESLVSLDPDSAAAATGVVAL